MVKEVLGRLFALYALLVFLLTLLLVCIPVALLNLLSEPLKQRLFFGLARGWMFLFLTLIFCPVRRFGRSYFEKGECYVVVFNHRSLMDVPVSSPGVPGINKTLAKASMGKIPFFGMVYRMGSILVNRADPDSRSQSFQEMKDALDKGYHMILFPEGTRNRSGEPLANFYDGAFSLAIEKQVPLIPAVLIHTDKILPLDKTFYLWPHSIQLHFLQPIGTKGLTEGDVERLKTEVYAQMKYCYQKHN
jgi:1-acyl-sn-glycerol-3-phosphate acyltransferase